jgi:hypothetical protein
MQAIQSVGVLSCAKIMGAIYGALGLIFGPIFFLATFLGALAGGVAILIFLPLFYGALGFSMGALSAWAYNIAAKKLGGIQIDIRDSRAV